MPAGAVERMRDRAHEPPRAVARQHGIGIECDDERARAPERRFAELGGEAGVGGAAHLAGELEQRPAFALPSHPHAFGFVEPPRAHEQVERAHAVFGLVALVELGDAAHRRLEDGAIVRTRLSLERLHVAEQREADVQVAVGQIRDLEMFDHRDSRRDARQERREHRECPCRLVDGPAEVELRQPLRREHDRREPVDEHQREFRQWHEAEHNQRDGGGCRCAFGEGVARQSGDEDRREHAERAPVEQLMVAQGTSIESLAAPQAIADDGLELIAAFVDEPPAHMPGHFVRGVPEQGGARKRHDLVGDLELGHLRAGGEQLERVAVAVAALEVHRAVRLGGIAAQGRLHERHVLEERAPVERVEEADARDRVGDRHLVGGLLLLLVGRCGLQHDPTAVETAIEPGVHGVATGLQLSQPLREADEERRRAVLSRRVEFADERADRLRRVLRGEYETLRPFVCFMLRSLCSHDLVRKTAQILDDPGAEHDRHGPHLTDRERRDLLVSPHETQQRLFVHARIGMGDECEKRFVDTREVGVLPAHEPRKPDSVVGGEIVANQLRLLFDQVVVVEQPFAGRRRRTALSGPNSEFALVGGQGRGGFRAYRDQRGRAYPTRSGGVLFGGDLARFVGEPIGRQQLSAKRGTGGQRAYVRDIGHAVPPSRVRRGGLPSR